MLVPSSPRKLSFVSPAGRFPGLLASGKWFFSAFLSKLVQLSGGTTFSLTLPPPPSLGGRQTSPGFILTHPWGAHGPSGFRPFSALGVWIWVCVCVRPLLPAPCPLFGGPRSASVTASGTGVYSVGGCYVFCFFFFFPRWSTRVLLALRSREEKNSFSASPHKTRTPLFSRCISSAMGCPFQRGGTCVRAFVGKSVSWLCASPKSASSGSPVSDRQTQRQAQAGGGGRRAGAGTGGEWRVGRRQGQGRRKKWNPIPVKKRRSREQISSSLVQISLFRSSLVFFLPFSVFPFSPPVLLFLLLPSLIHDSWWIFVMEAAFLVILG